MCRDVVRRFRPLVAATALAALLPTAACTTPKSVLVVPSCVERLEIEGENTRAGTERIRFDHTFELPLTTTHIVVKHGGRAREYDVMNSRPDIARFVVGGVLAGAGAALLTLAVIDTVETAGQPLPGRTPFLYGGAGVGIALGSAGMLTGWHPAEDTFIRADCQAPDPTPRSGGR